MASLVKPQPQQVDPGVLRVIAARSTPNFYIVDEDLRVLFAWAPEGEHEFAEISLLAPAPDRLPAALERGVRALTLSMSVKAPISLATLLAASVVLRVMPLSSTDGRAHYGVFLEHFKTRSGIRPAAKHYNLTPREVDVLEQIVKGASTVQIAERLHIAESTVQDHVKNISVKMRVHKRSEIVARVIGLLPPVG
jgi:DNA-binding CsgD family transcriptional regulator